MGLVNLLAGCVCTIHALLDEEWTNCWKYRCEAFRQLEGADEAQFLFLTGRIPLFLQQLIDAEGDLRQKIDTSEGGGEWIASNIEQFYNVHVVGGTLKHYEVRQPNISLQ